MKRNFAERLSLLAVLFLVIASLAACKTKSSTNWDSRVGTYTYDQAVTDLGPPDKQAKLTDGQTIAEWITHRSSSGLSIGTGFFSGGGGSGMGVGVGHSVGSSSYDKTLKLTFGTNNVLAAWSKN